MRLSCILLVVAAAFVATLDATAAGAVAISEPNTMNAVDSMPVVESAGRFLRARKEDKYEVDELDDEEDEDDVQEDRMFSWASGVAGVLTGKANAVNAMRKVLSSKSGDMAEAVMGLSKKEVDDMFKHGAPALAKVLPDYHPGMTPNQFGILVQKSTLNNHEQQMLILGFSRYIKLNNL